MQRCCTPPRHRWALTEHCFFSASFSSTRPHSVTCVRRGGCTPHTIILGGGNGNARAVFCGRGEGDRFHCFVPALNMSPRPASSPNRKKSRTAVLFLRSFLSTAFLASFLSLSSQRVCVCMCVCVSVSVYVHVCAHVYAYIPHYSASTLP